MTEPQQQAGAANSFPTVGRWRVTALPAGWMFIANFGVRQMISAPQAVVANIGLGEDTLAPTGTLADYLEIQIRLIRNHLVTPTIAGPQPIPFQGAEEAYLVFIRHVSAEAASMLYVQTYVRSGRWVGIVTLTTLEADLPTVRPQYDAFVKGLRILPPVVTE